MAVIEGHDGGERVASDSAATVYGAVTSPPTCGHCGSELATVVYQSKSADEAPDIMTLCKACRLDAEALRDAMVPRASVALVRPLSSIVQGPPRLARIEDAYSTPIAVARREVELRLDAAQSQSALSLINSRPAGFSRYCVRQCQCTLRILGSPGVVGTRSVRFREGEGALCKSQLSSLRLAPGATLSVAQEIPVSYDPDLWSRALDYSVEVLDVAERLLHDGSTTLRVVSHFPSGLVRAETESTDETLDDEELGFRMLVALFEAGYYPRDIRDYVSRSELYDLVSMSKAAEDVSSVNAATNKFTCKADGERVWVMLMGCMWYLVRPYHRTKVAAWVPHHGAREYSRVGPVLDCEMLHDGTKILIDVLIGSTGEAPPRSRTLYSMLGHYSSLLEMGLVPPGLVVREYLNTYEEAIGYCASVPYPTDGVVALTAQGMYTSKLKAQRSLEVAVRDGTLTSSDGVIVGKLLPEERYPDSSILELRLGAVVTNGRIAVEQVIVRADKVVANSSDVCRSVLSICAGAGGTDSVILRSVTDLCFVARACIYETALCIPGLQVIVDVGIGRGQSVGLISALMRNAKASGRSLVVVVIDPNLTATSLPRLDRDVAHNYHHSIGEAQRSLKAMLGAAVAMVGVATTLGEVMSSESFMTLLRTSVCCFTCAFSASYVAGEMSRLASMSLPVIGCCYVYDGADESGILMEVEGISMRLLRPGSTEAIASWPGRGREATQYREPAVMRRHFSPAVTVPFLQFHDPVPFRVGLILKHLSYVVSRPLRHHLLGAIASSRA